MDTAIPSSPPKKLLPAFPAMGKFVAGETTGITHVYRDESDDVLMPGIMSSSPVKRSHMAAFGKDAIRSDTRGDRSSPVAHSPPPSSPCARHYSHDSEDEVGDVTMTSITSDVSHSADDNEASDKLQLQSMLSREPRTALTSLPIVNLTRPSPNRINSLIMDKRVNQNKDLMSKPSTQELLAIMGEYYPPVAIGRSSLQSQVVLSKSNRQISRRHVTTWYDLERHVIAISCSGWNGCRVMNRGRVFRTAENVTLLEEAKVKYGDIFEPSTELKEGQENAPSSSGSFGTFLFKNDRMEVDASEILVDVRGERFMIRLSDEGEEIADEDAEMTTDETDDEELVPIQKVSESRLNKMATVADVHVVKKQKVVEETPKPVKATVPNTPSADKENKTHTPTASTPSTISTPATVTATPSSAKRSAKASHKPVLKTVKVMKPVARQSVVRQVTRPAGRLEKPKMLQKEADKVVAKPAADKPVQKTTIKADVKETVKETEVKPEVKKTEVKPVEKAAEPIQKPAEKPAEVPEPVKTVQPIEKVVKSTISTRETTPVAQTAKATPKATPKAASTPIASGTPKTATSTPKRKKSPSPEIPLSPSKIDLKAIRNLVCNHLAFSRLSCTPLQTVMAVSPKISIVPKSQLQQILRDIDCVGIIHREGKDASGKPLEEEYYYVPERDSDQDRVKMVNETKGGAGVRSCRKVHKQYYWKKPTL
ncbi:Protein PLM2 [Yarrowia sp. C11]|nr:Protein PLM2 [Yarrowia sp. E02]KAG5372300.1 Protein PLM2 [Yarrowia sp. C11]